MSTLGPYSPSNSQTGNHLSEWRFYLSNSSMPYLVLIGMAAVTDDLDVSKIWLEKPNEIRVRCQFHASIPLSS